MDAFDDVSRISKAYQESVGLDEMDAMNAASKGDATDLKYYMVPASWMKKAWPMLTFDCSSGQLPDDDWKVNIGSVTCNELLQISERIHKNESLDGQSRTLEVGETTTPVSATMAGLQHKADFFLLGKNAWALVKGKFGCDTQIPCNVEHKHGRLNIKISAWISVAVSQAGRLEYPEHFREESSPAKSVSDDEMAESIPYNRGGETDLKLDDECVITTTNGTHNGHSNYWDEAPSPEPIKPQLKPHGSGLSNLGNTCFMNSTLQCLAHTEPLRRYFLSGDYERDLNRENPLGTGGDLAVEFYKLLEKMWLESEKKETNTTYTTYSNMYADAVSPREFKAVLGKHASQFIGYDQHDSQELATYLLDALHEDTNRVTKKPYVEKPEKKDGESDEDAATKAWNLHLTRENSRVLENFMGQVKSRVECCREGCDRVSTTFDPFMYLSVPIPGTAERSIKVTFVPLCPEQKPQRFTLTMQKTSTVGDLKIKTIEELRRFGVDIGDVESRNVVAVELFHNEVYAWHDDTHEIDSIAPGDITYLFQVRPAADVEKISQQAMEAQRANQRSSEELLPNREPYYNIDPATNYRLSHGDEWSQELAKYLQHELGFINAFNPTKGSMASRLKYYNDVVQFVDACYREIDGDGAGSKRARDSVTPFTDDNTKQDSIAERCAISDVFRDVSSRADLAALEFIASKMRTEILELEKAKTDINADGILIEIRHQYPYSTTTYSKKPEMPPVVLRVAGSMTVYDLRCELAKRLKRSLALPNGDTGGQATAFDTGLGTVEENTLRRLPLLHTRKQFGCSTSSSNSTKRYLGSIKDTFGHTAAKRDDEEEEVLFVNLVGDHGSVTIDWSSDAFKQFDTNAYIAVDEPEDAVSATERMKKSNKKTSVLDCIKKYCQQEQLEETDMWYCNQCKDHVRAWKKFDIFLCPAILIVHLKRFQFSARTHRRDKIGDLIDFPLEGLDLSEVVKHWNNEEKPIYDCYAVSNHFGGLGGGHYTAHCLNSDGNWCYYDDSRIEENVDQEKVVSDAAYVLYYRRHDVPVGDDFPLPLVKTPLAEPAQSTAIVVRDISTDEKTGTSDSMSVAAVDEEMETVSQYSDCEFAAQ